MLCNTEPPAGAFQRYAKVRSVATNCGRLAGSSAARVHVNDEGSALVTVLDFDQDLPAVRSERDDW